PTGENTGYFAVARYLADGALDTTFGNGGMMTAIGSSHSDENINNVSLGMDSDGNILLGSSGAKFDLARLTGDPAVPDAPVLFIGNQATIAPTSGTTSMVFDVLLAQSSAQQILVAYTTFDGTAHAGTNYTAV